MEPVPRPAQPGDLCRFVTCGISPSQQVTIRFGVDRFEGEAVPSSAYSLGSASAYIFVALGVNGKGEKTIAKGTPTVEGRLLGKNLWFEDECVNLGIGMLWMGSLTPSSACQTFSFHSGHGRNILDPPLVRGVSDAVSGPTLCFSTAFWQGAFDLHKKFLKIQPCDLDPSQNTAPRIHQDVAEGSNVVRKTFRHVMRSTLLDLGLSPGAKQLSSSNLWQIARNLDADVMIFPTTVLENHWISVAVTGLAVTARADVLPVLGDSTRWSSPDSSANDMEPTLRIIILDSYENKSVTKARRVANSSGPTKSSKQKSLRELLWARGTRTHTIATAVVYALATEWVMKLRLPKDFKNAKEFVQASKAAYTCLMNFVSISAPAVPQQEDTNQCGPMAILAMQAFCENELFRNYCLGCGAFCSPSALQRGAQAEDPSLDLSDPPPPVEPYSFETAFELRAKMLHFVRQVKDMA